MYLFGQKAKSRWRNFFCIIYLAKNTRIDGATILRQPKWMCLAKSLRVAAATIFAFVWPKPQNRWRNYFKIAKMHLFGKKASVDGATICALFVWPKAPE